MDDKVKHRIVGAVVIAAFLVILVPALIKKVSWHDDTAENKSMIASSMPAISTPQPFETAQVAQVSLDNPTAPATTTASLPTDTTVNTIPEPVEPQPVITENGTAQPAALTTSATSLPTTTTTTTTTTVTPEPVASTTSAPEPTPTPTLTSAPVVTTPSTTPLPAPIKAKTPAPVVTVKKTVAVTKTVPHAPVKVVKTVTVKKAVVIKKNPPVIAAGTNNYCLQMGAFANPENANLLVQRLKMHGFSSAHSTTMTLPSGITVHKVSLCKRMTPSEAVALRDRLILLSRTPIIVVRT